MEVFLNKLATVISDPLSLVLILGVYGMYTLYKNERAERIDVQKQKDQLTASHLDQSLRVMAIVEKLKI